MVATDQNRKEDEEEIFFSSSLIAMKKEKSSRRRRSLLLFKGHHQGVDSDYHNLGNTTLHVQNRNYVRKSMSYVQLYLIGHIRLVTTTISM